MGEMITKVKNKIKKDQFIIGFIYINKSFFIIRKGIYDALKDVSLEMKGRLLDVDVVQNLINNYLMWKNILV